MPDTSHQTVRSFQRILSHLLRLYPFLSGCGTLANLTPIRHLCSRSTQPIWSRVLRDHGVFADLKDFNGRSAYFIGDVDRKVTLVCQRIIRHGDTVLDVGANIGTLTMRFAHLVGTLGHIVSFEPNPRVACLLRAALIRNGLRNVTLCEYALGDYVGESVLRVPNEHSGRASLRPGCLGTPSVVKVMRLSDVLRSMNLSRVRLVKIDVEGLEDAVLRGAYDAFYHDPPDALVLEASSEIGFDCAERSLEVLMKLHYDVYSIRRTFCRLKFDRVVNCAGTRSTAHDFLAIHSSAASIKRIFGL